MRVILLHIGFAAACICLSSVLARAQMISPNDEKEAARFAAVARTVEKGGYQDAAVVGHGSGAVDDLFALLATNSGKGVLLIVIELSGGQCSPPVAIERDENAANLGIAGIQFNGFLGVTNLYDIIVSHRPFRLEMTQTFDTHHVLRRNGSALELTCDFDGNSMSSYSKGIGGVTTRRTVTVTKVPGAKTLVFIVTSDEETRKQDDRGATAVATPGGRTTVRYELPPTGACTQLSPTKK